MLMFVVDGDGESFFVVVGCSGCGGGNYFWVILVVTIFLEVILVVTNWDLWLSFGGGWWWLSFGREERILFFILFEGVVCIILMSCI